MYNLHKKKVPLGLPKRPVPAPSAPIMFNYIANISELVKSASDCIGCGHVYTFILHYFVIINFLTA